MDQHPLFPQDSQPVVLLDLDREGSTWLAHLFGPQSGLVIHRLAHASHHSKEFPASLDKWMVAHAEFAPARGGRQRLKRLLPMQSFPGLSAYLETAAAAGLGCELLKRAHTSPQESQALFVQLVELLQGLSDAAGSGPVPALYSVHTMLTALSLLSPAQGCARCEAELTPPAHFHVSTGEVTCHHHGQDAHGAVLWGTEKWSLHLALLDSPTLSEFRQRTSAVWQAYGEGLGWSMLEDLIALATRTTGPLRSWAFLLQLRPKSRRQ